MLFRMFSHGSGFIFSARMSHAMLKKIRKNGREEFDTAMADL